MKIRCPLLPAAVLVSLVLAGCASSGQRHAEDREAPSSPSVEQLEERQVARDQGVYRDTQARIAELNASKGVRIDNYALAKAQCWLDVSFHEYTRNDRGGFPAAALAQAQGILDELEAGRSPDVSETPLVNGARRLRPDLWDRFAQLRNQPEAMSCAASRLACAEVELVHAGNEIRQGGWRHASPYIQIAEDLTAEAEKQAESCKPRVEPAGARADVDTVHSVTSVEVRFHFDRHGAADILPEDQEKLQAFAKDLQEQFVQVDSLTLLGHTDRMGAREYNDRLSARRAVTVRKLLNEQGVTQRMAIVPLGPTEEFSEGCSEIAAGRRAEAIECLQPDRRVTVQVVGTRKR